MNHATIYLLLAIGIAGCRSRATPASAPAAEARDLAAPAAGREDPLRAARRLALARVSGGAVVDRRIRALEAVAEKLPRRLETWIELGRAWVWKARETSDPGYYLNADACADVALDLAPNSALALDLRALVLLNRHEFEAARRLAQSLVDADPEAPMAWGSLSDALLELGDLPAAERAAERMLDLKPNLPSYARISYFQWLRGDTEAALESARLAIDAGGDPKNPEPRAWMLVHAASLFWHRGDYAGADAGFEQALRTLPDYPPALLGRGRAAMARGDARGAADFFERAQARGPSVETAWLLAEAREQLLDRAGASAAWEAAERLGRLGDRRSLSLLYSTRNIKPAEALALAETERALRGDVYTDDAVAWALYRNGRAEDAKRAIDRARRYGTRDARLLFHAGAIEIALHRRAEGRRLIEEALRLNPAFDRAGAAEARKLLEAS